MNSQSTNLFERRLGKSPYWLKFTREEHGISASWRLNGWLKPPRAPKRDYAIPLFDISPQHPLLTLILGDESFPLLVDHWSAERGGRYTLCGQRKLSASKERVATWTAKLCAKSVGNTIRLEMDVKVRVTPTPRSGALRYTISVPFFRPYVKEHPTARKRHDQATVIWGERAFCAVSFVAPSHADLEFTTWDERGALECLVPLSPSGRAPLSCSIALHPAKSILQANSALAEHYAQAKPLALPEIEPWSMTLREASSHAIALITDKGAYDVKGTERVYLRPPIVRMEMGCADRPSYFAGFPDFPVDAARAMIDWHSLTGDEPILRLAALAARGVAADFSVMAIHGERHSNKGAFWDRLTLPAEGILPHFSNAYGEDSHAIVTSARIARALFDVFSAIGDPLFRQIALNTCHWLILKQNGDGYYQGDHMHGRTGAPFGGANLLAGCEAIRPLTMAFRATGNEVFVKSAWKIADHVISDILPEMKAKALFARRNHAAQGSDSCEPDSPVALASVILSLLDLDAESPNKRLREAVHMAGCWMRAFTFDPLVEPDLNYDGMNGGLSECAQAALMMFNVERDPAWLQLGLRAVRAMPIDSRGSWRSVPAFLMSLLGLVPLLPEGSVDFAARSAAVGWHKYVMDEATHEYVSVANADRNDPAPVDFLPMVCRQDDHMLVLVLSDQPVEGVHIMHNRRNPVLRDLVTKELISGPLPLHRLPFGGRPRYGAFTVGS